MSAMHDNFSINSGSSLTGHAPDTPVGSVNWTDFLSSLSLPAWVGAPSGHGITSPSGAVAFGGYDLSSLAASLTVTFQFTSATTVPSIVTQHRRTAGSSPSYIGVDFVLNSGQVNLTTTIAGGSSTLVGSPGSYTFAAATAYTIAIQFVTSGGTTTVDVTINGTAVITGATITDPAVQSPGQLVLGTENGSAGDVVVSSVDVATSAGGPTTATLSNGPANCTAGVESAPYGVQLDAAAGGSGATINLSSSVGGDAFHATSGGSPVASIAIAPGATLGAFRLVAASAGVRNISITSAGLTIVDSPLAVTAASPPSVPTTATLTGPTACTVGVESAPVVVTLDAPAPDGGTAILIGHTGSGDTFSATSGGPDVPGIVIPQGQASGSFYILAGAAGSRSVSITSTGLSIVGSPLDFTATAPAPPATAGPLEGYYPTPSLADLYFVRGKPDGLAWNGTGYEAEVASNWPSYAIPAADVGGTGRYTGPDPDPSTPGRARLYKMAGASASPTDTLVDAGDVGPPAVTQAQLAAALASLVTTAQLTTALGPLATTNGLSALATNTPTNAGLAAALAPLATTAQLAAVVAPLATTAQLSSGVNVMQWNGNPVVSTVPGVPVVDQVYSDGNRNYAGLASTFTATSIALDPADQVNYGRDNTGGQVALWGAVTGPGAAVGAAQIALITASDPATGVQTIKGWSSGITPSGTIPYVVFWPNTLAPSGLDAIQVEADVNARQALAPILAASAGVLAGSGTGTITIKGGGNNNATSRITATTDGTGNRTSVTLNLPA